MSIAVGAAEKGVLQIYETVFRPEEKRHGRGSIAAECRCMERWPNWSARRRGGSGWLSASA